ncbi:MAG: biotin/lipoyl-binding protein, partial [Gemmatimonadaceae bacterium]|nr:biotin/lipoyl-binding protein [Gemmatimonadaceae bacterium]
MKYVVEIAGERHEVELGADGARYDGATIETHLADVPGTPVRQVRIGREVHRVVARRLPGKGRYVLWLDGHRYEVEALDERTRTIRDMTVASAGASGPAPLVAPMPGLVVRLLVAVGDVVQAGQPLAVMEAMKMENELRAPA